MADRIGHDELFIGTTVFEYFGEKGYICESNILFAASLLFIACASRSGKMGKWYKGLLWQAIQILFSILLTSAPVPGRLPSKK